MKLVLHMRTFWNRLDVILDIMLVTAVALRAQVYRENDQAVKASASYRAGGT